MLGRTVSHLCYTHELVVSYPCLIQILCMSYAQLIGTSHSQGKIRLNLGLSIDIVSSC